MTVTFELDLDWVKKNHLGKKYLGHSSFRSKVNRPDTQADRQTHAGSIAGPGPLATPVDEKVVTLGKVMKGLNL